MEESIYKIVPQPHIPPPKQPLYHSKHPKLLLPTATTFSTSGLALVMNVGGSSYNQPPINPHLTMGTPKGSLQPIPTRYLRKKQQSTVNLNTNISLEQKSFNYPETNRKPPIPKLQKLNQNHSQTNFILTNKIAAILMNTKKVEKSINWKEKENYGKVPQYITQIKTILNQQNNTLQKQNHTSNFILSETQVQQIREGLKSKWNLLNEEYQKITHKIVDGLSFKAYKTKLEEELSQIESDIKRINKKYITVNA